MRHNRKGNCWAIPKDRDNDLVDVCKRHDEVRGDCSECPRCEACDAEQAAKEPTDGCLDIDEIERLTDRATFGPWTVKESGLSTAVVSTGVDPRHVVFWTQSLGARGGDLAFIAAARTAVPALVAEVRRLREEAEKVRTGDLLIDEAWDVDVHDEVSRLRAENARLKAALRREL